MVRRMRRRELITRMGSAAVLAIATPVSAQGRTVRIGCTFDNSGVERANGSGAFRGATALFGALNRTGGIAGAKVELVLADDQFKPDLTQQHARTFDDDASIVAMLSPLGTRQTAAAMEVVKDMAIVGPITGTAGLRKTSGPNVFWVRASYDQEIDKLIKTAVTLGFNSIGIVYPNDPLGKGVFAAFERSMVAARLTPTVVATTPGTTSPEVAPAAEAVVKASPQLVLLGFAGMSPAFVRALRERGGTSAVYGMSISASAANIEAMGELGRGFGFSIVVPSPFAPKFEIVRRYQADMAASGWTDFSLPTLEGYINARVLAEGLRRAGPDPKREALKVALEKIESLDLGGMRVGYGASNRQGSAFVDVAVLGEKGRILT